MVKLYSLPFFNYKKKIIQKKNIIEYGDGHDYVYVINSEKYLMEKLQAYCRIPQKLNK